MKSASSSSPAVSVPSPSLIHLLTSSAASSAVALAVLAVVLAVVEVVFAAATSI